MRETLAGMLPGDFQCIFQAVDSLVWINPVLSAFYQPSLSKRNATFSKQHPVIFKVLPACLPSYSHRPRLPWLLLLSSYTGDTWEQHNIGGINQIGDRGNKIPAVGGAHLEGLWREMVHTLLLRDSLLSVGKTMKWICLNLCRHRLLGQI